MLSKLWSMTVVGVDGILIEIEIDISNKLPRFDIVGLPDTAIREAKYRVRTAINNSGFEFPYARILINLAPANIKKQGPRYDLPIALGLLMASGQMDNTPFHDTVIIGELALDGSVRAVPGILSMALAAQSYGLKKFVCAKDNAAEAAVVNNIDVYPIHSLRSIDNIFREKYIKTATKNEDKKYHFDYNEVVGQEMVKRAVLIAAAGQHHFLLCGSPGCGKSMIAKRFATILPTLSESESIESTQVYSVAGLANGLVKKPPFRAPHHNISSVALVGGGSFPQPGEISLAHNGVLFLDELPEFSRKTLDMLRQPLEDGGVTISRAQYKVLFPCKFTLVAAMNPCPCGYYGDEHRMCNCPEYMVQRYQKRISGPLLDRFDLHINVRRVEQQFLIQSQTSTSSSEMRRLVIEARTRQEKRFATHNIKTNAQMSLNLIKKFCKLCEESESLIKKANESSGFSARSYQKILKISRTIADLDQSEVVRRKHVAEALQYRFLDTSPF
ncbi:YifB family Mg chelatase-like AAA ATPase [Candidatus Uabimicrobium amorphum]|uniref:ATP-dependent protease n=1 Tax=Uabimicrobium amorphum TaxID=2596890 RepID=A0A5S9F5F3_UABAM|nr:YifB family Mg chelatase-like AAA ATPase [Candidatus Uabimicrobium amorphum]BBM85212.1 ATP-dependent protease [Candidatus Uabimicrobium amorphum]